MAFHLPIAFASFPKSDQVKSRKTDPLIQCIIDNKPEKLKKKVRGTNINGLYPSADWEDDVTLLTAAAVCGNEAICNFLLGVNADPNILSRNGLTTLHYAATTPGVPLNIVRRLLAAKASPDGHEAQPYTPFYFAAENDRLDIVKALIEAGANPERNYGVHQIFNDKVELLLNKLPEGNKAVEKFKIFFTFTAAVAKKSHTETFNLFGEHFLEEHPFNHLALLEIYFNVVGPSAEQYQQSSIKWLKDSKNADIYIDGFIERFPRIPYEYRISALKSLRAVICMMREISPQIFNVIIPILIKYLLPTSEIQGNVTNFLILSILCVAMDKFSKQKPTADSRNSVVLKELCSALLPFTKTNCSTDVSIPIYHLFAALYEFVPEHINSYGLTSVPESVLLAVDMRTDDVIKEKLEKLDTNLRYKSLPQSSQTVKSLDDAADSMASKKKKKKKKNKKKKDNLKVTSSKETAVQESNLYSDIPKTSVEQSDSTVCPFLVQTEDSKVTRKWHSVSHRWKSKLEKLARIEASQVYRLGNLTVGKSSEFEIAKGSDGTWVFLGLRDDGTEVAVKRMYRLDYQDLKNEVQFLRLPELDDPYIVRYMDFTEDDHFGYLALQLCEYTLEEYIQKCLPEDSSQKLQVQKKIVKEVLRGLKVLHSKDTKVLHRDIKPQNVLIDITGRARLADFGISRRLKLEETTCRTDAAGTKYWKARETLEEDSNSHYKRSSDIQVAGMLVYYVLSCGHHPFGTGVRCETNILDGKYSLVHLEDETAKDLVEWMINHEPKERPSVEETLCHPFFWTDIWKVDYLTRLGNVKDVVNCCSADPDLLSAVESITAGRSFSDWKSKVPSELVQKSEKIRKKPYPENTLGLLRFIRNLHEHHSEDAERLNLMLLFPDLFGIVFKFAKKRGWNNKPHLEKWLCSATV